MKTELQHFTGDYEYVIVGAHLSLEDTRKQFGEEIKLDQGEHAEITKVKHWWVRYEFLGPDNTPDDFNDPEPGDAAWVLYDKEARPGGAVRRATVITGLTGVE